MVGARTNAVHYAKLFCEHRRREITCIFHYMVLDLCVMVQSFSQTNLELSACNVELEFKSAVSISRMGVRLGT